MFAKVCTQVQGAPSPCRWVQGPSSSDRPIASTPISRDMAEVPPLCRAGLAFGTAQPQTDLWSGNKKRQEKEASKSDTDAGWTVGRNQAELPGKQAAGRISVQVDAFPVLPTVRGSPGKAVLQQVNHPGLDGTVDARAGRDHLAWHFPKCSTGLFSSY